MVHVPVPARLRLYNDTDVDFDRLEVDLEYDFGALPAHEESAYLDVVDLTEPALISAFHGAGEYRTSFADGPFAVLSTGDYTCRLFTFPGAMPDPDATPPRWAPLFRELLTEHILESSAPSDSEP